MISLECVSLRVSFEQIVCVHVPLNAICMWLLTFRLRLIFFWIAAAITAFPFTKSFSFSALGLVGRDVVEFEPSGPIEFDINRFGVVTPVFWPVVVPSLRGNCTFLVSKQSSPTQSSSRLLTEMTIKRCQQIESFESESESSVSTYNQHSEHKTIGFPAFHEYWLFQLMANRRSHSFELAGDILLTMTATKSNQVI